MNSRFVPYISNITEDRVSVSIPSYNFPHSIIDLIPRVKRGQQIELTGQVTRIDDEKVTIDLGPPVTVDIDKVRLVEKYRPQKRRTPLRDKWTSVAALASSDGW